MRILKPHHTLALAAVVEVARRAGPDGYARRTEIAAALGEDSERAFEALFQSLARFGLLESKRGPTGGVRLARPSSAISLGDTLRAIEAVSTVEAMPAISATPLGQALGAAADSYLVALDKITLADLCEATADAQAAA